MKKKWIKWKPLKRGGKAQTLEEEDFKCLIRLWGKVDKELGGGNIPKKIMCVYSRIVKTQIRKCKEFKTGLN